MKKIKRREEVQRCYQTGDQALKGQKGPGMASG